MASIFSGKKEKFSQLPTKDPGQIDLLQSLTGGLGGPLQAMIQNLMQMLQGGEEAEQRFAAPAMRQFEQEIAPGIAEQFAGRGSLRSSSFQNAIAGAGAGLAENLSAQRGTQQQNAMQQILGLLNPALQTQTFENFYQPSQPGMLQSLLPSLFSAGGSVLGSYLGRPQGSTFNFGTN